MAEIPHAAVPAAQLAPDPERRQVALTFGADDGEPGLALEPADRQRAYRVNARFDTRRAAEWVEAKGLRTPVQQWVSIGGRPLPDAVRWLRKRFKTLTEHQAITIWLDCQAKAAPFLHHQLSRIELEAGADAAGSLALAHFLAASAMGSAIARDRGLPAMSPKPVIVDGSASGGQAGLFEGRPDERPGSPATTLPPKGAD